MAGAQVVVDAVANVEEQEAPNSEHPERVGITNPNIDFIAGTTASSVVRLWFTEYEKREKTPPACPARKRVVGHRHTVVPLGPLRRSRHEQKCRVEFLPLVVTLNQFSAQLVDR